MDYEDVWVILPVYNERNLEDTLVNIKKHIPNIIVVNDGSISKYDDLSVDILITHHKNYGKGAALRTGCDYAFLRKKARAVILMDSDGQHDPSSIPEFIARLDNYNIVFGSRSFRYPMPLSNQFGNWFISKMARLLFGIKVSDILSGYKAMTRYAYFKIRWFSRRFTVEPDIAVNVIKKNIKYCEIRVPTIYSREANVRKKEGFRLLLYLLLRRLFNEDSSD